MFRSSRSLRSVAGIAVLSAVSLCFLGACSDGRDTAEPADDAVTTTTVATSSTADDAAAGSSSELTEDEFITEANAICATGNGEIEGIFADVEPATGPSADQQQELLDNGAQQVDDIEALGVPSELEATVGPFITEARTTIEQSRTTSPEQFFAGNPFADLNTTAIGIGLDTCGA
ncbi:hypothetical protein BH10ACT3_BH10ACT3_11150 [soil metagenome]